MRQRDGGRGLKLDYIDITTTIKRLAEVCGSGWDWIVDDSSVEWVPFEDGAGTYLASSRGHLRVTLPDGTVVTRGGSGADTDSRDPDKAIKTADAEALKKAGHKYLISLYLWDEEKRDGIAEYRNLADKAGIPALQKALVRITGKEPAELKALYGDDLGDREFLLELLNAA